LRRLLSLTGTISPRNILLGTLSINKFQLLSPLQLLSLSLFKKRSD